MIEKQEIFMDLTERIGEVFYEINNEVVAELRQRDGDYAALCRETGDLSAEYPVIEKVCDGDSGITLTSEEVTALARYISLKMDMDDIERKRIYFRGHTDCFAYLKKIGAV